MQESAEAVAQWTIITEHIRELITSQQYSTWFRSVRPVDITTERVVIAVPNAFLKDWILNYYADVISKAITAALGSHPTLSIILDEKLEILSQEEAQTPTADGATKPNPTTDRDSAGPQAAVPHGGSQQQDPTRPGSDSGQQAQEGNQIPGLPHGSSLDRASKFANPLGPIARLTSGNHSLSPLAGGPSPFRRDVEQGTPLNPSYQFDTFIIGPANRLCHAAAISVAECPSGSYNPFFLHGPVGLGKTHLLQSICHRVLEKNSQARIAFISCETFINQFIASVEKGNVESFRTKYRHADLLLIDDIHLLAHKERTQEEFFHTFNALYQAGKQIVLSSDSHPREIPTLEERLVSRFKWGLVAMIEPPDFETRVAIVNSKAKLRGRGFPDDVSHFIADNVTTNIRELEGAVIKVIGYASLTDSQINLDLAKEALRDVARPSVPQITMPDVIQTVTRFYGVKSSDLLSKKRSHSVAFPRQIVMYLARRHTALSLEEIGFNLGGRDHTTVLYGVERIKSLMSEDSRLREILQQLSQDLASKP